MDHPQCGGIEEVEIIGLRMHTSVRVLFLMMFVAASILELRAQPLPKAKFKPGHADFSCGELRLSSNERLLTYVQSECITVIDIAADSCVVIVPLSDSRLYSTPADWRRSASISPTGGAFVTYDEYGSGELTWYTLHNDVSTIVYNTVVSGLSDCRLLNDTTIVVSSTDASIGDFILFASGLQRPLKSGRSYVVYDEQRLLGASIRNDTVWVETMSTVIPVVLSRARSIIPIDSLSIIIVTDSLNYLLNVRTGFIRDSTRKRLFGALQGPLIIAQDGDCIVTCDLPSFHVVDTLATDVAMIPSIFHSRYVVLRDSIYDHKRRSAIHYAATRSIDISLYGTVVAFTRDNVDMPEFRYRDTVGNWTATHLADGLVTSVVQHPLDSTVFAATRATHGYVDWGFSGHVLRLDNTGVHNCSKAYYNLSIGPYRTINSRLVAEMQETTKVRQGYVMIGDTIEEIRMIEFSPFEPDDLRIQRYVFSDDGRELELRRLDARLGECTFQLTFASTIKGFIPATMKCVISDTLYEEDECFGGIPLQVFSVSPLAPYVGVVGDSIELWDAARMKRLAVTTREVYSSETWADSGTTLRLFTIANRIVSLHKNGNVDVVALPQVCSSIDASRKWSNDGRLLTIWKRDTLISVDAETGQIVRNWSGAPWLRTAPRSLPSHIELCSVDGQVVVSMPGGSYALLPGIEVEPLTSVRSPHEEPDLSHALEQWTGRTSSGAEVDVFTMSGNRLVHEKADSDGWCELKGGLLSRGCYIVRTRTNRCTKVYWFIQD